MYLFILETLGTQELILVGIVALIVFGPRKLPEMARKAGSMLRELRSVSNDFKSTWAQEVKIAHEEDKSVSADGQNTNGTGLSEQKSNGDAVQVPETINKSLLPQVREVSEEDFKKLVESKRNLENPEADKENWL